ncbi:YiiD C-terminal domain-containing protein [Luteolibacter algae]|uniref:YiiD C-terminal domain-containing protein n=1 Tax=Luteolibacter algae TaxID=454151 RepID=A0ABW5D6F6_9BACT
MNSEELENFLHKKIPVSKLMEIHVATCSQNKIILEAPLDINHNHLATAFGGSLVAIATLAGYCMLWTALGDSNAHVVVKRSSIEYYRPVKNNISALCSLPQSREFERFKNAFEKRHKARMRLDVTIADAGVECVRFSGEFVAII